MHCPSACINRTDRSLQFVSAPNSNKFHGKSKCSTDANLTDARTISSSPSKKVIFIICWAIFAGIGLFALPGLSSAAQVELAWDANDDNTDGYRVFQRQEGEAYDYGSPVWPKNGDTKTNTTCTIDGLADGTTYYFVVRACQGSSESNNSNEVEYQVSPENVNNQPIARAGANQVAMEGSVVHLDGTRSYDLEGNTLTHEYRQAAGPQVALSCDGPQCSFTAPDVFATTALMFELTVGDGTGQFDTATTIVLVTPSEGDQNDGDAAVGGSNGNQTPLEPLISFPVEGGTNVELAPKLTAAPYGDPDEGDHHLLTQWQITDTASQKEVMNLFGTESQLTALKIPQLVLEPVSNYSARVRFFDSQGLSSNWSAPIHFTTGQDEKDKNNNRIPDELEVSAHTDMNDDGIADIEQPELIKSVSTFDAQHLVGLKVEGGGNVIEVDAVTNIDPLTMEKPIEPGDLFPSGLMVYKIQVPTPGAEAYATFYLSDPVDPLRIHWTSYISQNGWQESTGTTTLGADGYVIERSLQDGGEEDADGTANGVIIDISAPLYPADDRSSLTSPDEGNAASGSGGGCFIQSFF